MTAPPTVLDASGLRCPLPVLRARKVIGTLDAGAVLEIVATDPAAPADFEAFCRETGHDLVGIESDGDTHRIRIARKT